MDATSICPHFRAPEQHDTCAAGVNYLKLTSCCGHKLVLRLPCLPISNRRGEVVAVCKKVKEAA